MPMDAESRRLIDWMEKGVYDALQKKYLRSLLFCICETVDGSMIEEYEFPFNYPNSDSQEVSMNINRTVNKKRGTFKCDSTTEITPNQMRSSACKMVRTLVQLMGTMDRMPEERTILMKLFYYEDVTPVDYEPPFFKSCSEEEAHHSWTKNSLKMEVGNVNSRHFVLALKGNHSQDDQYILAPVDKQKLHEHDGMADEDGTQDHEQQLARVKDWIVSRHTDTVELTDVLSHFPDISMVLTEEIMDKIVKDGFLTKTGSDSYTISKTKASEYEFTPIKEDLEVQVAGNRNKSPKSAGDDYMYMKADEDEEDKDERWGADSDMEVNEESMPLPSKLKREIVETESKDHLEDRKVIAEQAKALNIPAEETTCSKASDVVAMSIDDPNVKVEQEHVNKTFDQSAQMYHKP